MAGVMNGARVSARLVSRCAVQSSSRNVARRGEFKHANAPALLLFMGRTLG